MSQRGLPGFIRKRRISLGLTQEELAALMGASQRRISQLELSRPETVRVTEDLIERLAAALHVGREELMVEAGLLLPAAEETEVDDQQRIASMLAEVDELKQVPERIRRLIRLEIELARQAGRAHPGRLPLVVVVISQHHQQQLLRSP